MDKQGILLELSLLFLVLPLQNKFGPAKLPSKPHISLFHILHMRRVKYRKKSSELHKVL